MKKKLTLTMALLFTLSCTACSAAPGQTPVITDAASVPAETVSATTPETVPETLPAPTQENLHHEGLDQVRKQLEPSGAIAGIYYLGFHDGAPMDEDFWVMADPYTFRHPFMLEIQDCAAAEGGEVYCLVPADPGARVKVTEWDEISGREGTVLYESSSGEPLFLQGNVSDIMGNLSVSITDTYGNRLEQYHPGLSLKDGTVLLPGDGQPLVLDLTAPDRQEGDPVSYTFDLYLPNTTEDGYDVMQTTSQLVDGELILQLLIEQRVLPDTVQLNSWYLDETGEDLYLSVDGQPLRTVHALYDAPLFWNTFWN